MYIYMHIYIYAYTHLIYTYIYVYIYIVFGEPPIFVGTYMYHMFEKPRVV